MQVFDKLKEKLMRIIAVDEFAYLTVEDEMEAFAFYKADTQLLSFSEWKKFHKVDYPTIIKNSPILTDLVEHKRYVSVENTHLLEPLQEEFQVLNIYSIYLFPVIQNNMVVGFIDIAYVCDYYVIDKNVLDKIQHLVNEFSDDIKATVTEYRNKDML